MFLFVKKKQRDKLDLHFLFVWFNSFGQAMQITNMYPQNFRINLSQCGMLK